MLTPVAFPIAAAEERRLDRRRFLAVASGAALLVAAGEWAAACIGEAAGAPLEVAVPGVASLTAGEARTIAGAAGGEALVVRLAAGEVVAFDRRCPHLGCPVVWAGARQRFECPCHQAAFDARTGRVLFGPPRRGLTPAIMRPA